MLRHLFYSKPLQRSSAQSPIRSADPVHLFVRPSVRPCLCPFVHHFALHPPSRPSLPVCVSIRASIPWSYGLPMSGMPSVDGRHCYVHVRLEMLTRLTEVKNSMVIIYHQQSVVEVASWLWYDECGAICHCRRPRITRTRLHTIIEYFMPSCVQVTYYHIDMHGPITPRHDL